MYIASMDGGDVGVVRWSLDDDLYEVISNHPCMSVV
jgi:hypothetical protein